WPRWRQRTRTGSMVGSSNSTHRWAHGGAKPGVRAPHRPARRHAGRGRAPAGHAYWLRARGASRPSLQSCARARSVGRRGARRRRRARRLGGLSARPGRGVRLEGPIAGRLRRGGRDCGAAVGQREAARRMGAPAFVGHRVVDDARDALGTTKARDVAST
ncbi:hypothetical protein CFC21_011623, partial [Triticum aestivum]